MLLTTVQNHSSSIQISKTTSSWKDRLEALVAHPVYEDAKIYLTGTVKPALDRLKTELIERGFDAEIDTANKDAIRLVLRNKGVENFSYGVRLRSFLVPNYIPEENKNFFRVEVFILQGGQEYDVFGYSEEQIIADAIGQFEKHFHFLHLSNSEQPQV